MLPRSVGPLNLLRLALGQLASICLVGGSTYFWLNSRFAPQPNITTIRFPTMPGPTYTQHAFTLPSYPRGSHLITSDITSQLSQPLKDVKVGLLHLFLQHTSCAISLNENWDSDVRKDMSDSLDKIVVEDKAGKGIYRHDAEGSDDMPVRRAIPCRGIRTWLPAMVSDAPANRLN
ncbi:MAG: hypothetical protein Q9166_005913 [cf. Caloplaca sp. 2 TL-2023]